MSGLKNLVGWEKQNIRLIRQYDEYRSSSVISINLYAIPTSRGKKRLPLGEAVECSETDEGKHLPHPRSFGRFTTSRMTFTYLPSLEKRT